MIKIFVLCILFCLCGVQAAQAGSVSINDTVVNYKDPDGFKRADGVFPLFLEDMDNMFGLQTILVAAYLPDDYVRTDDVQNYLLPPWYVHLVYDQNTAFVSLGKSGYRATVWLIEQRIAKEYSSQVFKDMLGDVISKAIGREMTISSMRSLGVVKENKGNYSILAYGLGSLAGQTEKTAFPFASMTTFHLVNGKMLVSVQIGQITSEENLQEFKDKALLIASQITASSQSQQE